MQEHTLQFKTERKEEKMEKKIEILKSHVPNFEHHSLKKKTGDLRRLALQLQAISES